MSRAPRGRDALAAPGRAGQCRKQLFLGAKGGPVTWDSRGRVKSWKCQGRSGAWGLGRDSGLGAPGA